MGQMPHQMVATFPLIFLLNIGAEKDVLHEVSSISQCIRPSAQLPEVPGLAFLSDSNREGDWELISVLWDSQYKQIAWTKNNNNKQ